MAIRAAVVRFAALVVAAVGGVAFGAGAQSNERRPVVVAAADDVREPARDVQMPNPGELGTGTSASSSSTTTTLHGTPLPPSGINKIPERMPNDAP
jgi:hypothetical protein